MLNFYLDFQVKFFMIQYAMVKVFLLHSLLRKKKTYSFILEKNKGKTENLE